MKKKYIVQILALVCLVLSVGFLTSCDDDEENGSSQIELLSFGPTGVKLGDEIVFIGNNLDQVTAIVFYPSIEVPKSAFSSVTNERIKLNVPLNAEEGKVILKTPAGDIESKTVFSLEVPVVISTVTPAAKPGTDITITGENINWVEAVTFSNNLVVVKSNFVSQSQTEMVVTVPMEAQTGFLSFETGGTEPLTISSEDPLVVTLPGLTSFNPTSIRHANNLTITGTDLDLVGKVTFEGGAVVLSTNFVSHTETEIVVAVPAAAKDGKVILTALSGVEIASGSDLTIILPNVTAFSPSASSSHNPGVTLTMTGTDLDLVQKITFPFVADPVTTFVSQSTTQIQVVIPAGAKGGTLVMTTIHGVTVPVGVPFGDQLTLATVIYDDAVKSPLVQGGWGGSITNFASAEQVRLGATAIKVQFAGGWGGGAQMGNWDGLSVSTAGRTSFALSIYGGAGTEGKVINVLVGGKEAQVTIKEGEWKDVQIPLTTFLSPATISEVAFQDRDWSGAVFIDQVGLK